MSRTDYARAQASASIAAVERETGLSKDTLRVWERRYGFPVPTRDSHGERLYPPEQVKKLRLIRRLLDRGMRPGQLMKVPPHELAAQLQVTASMPAEGDREAPDATCAAQMVDALRLLKRYDETGLRALLAGVLLRYGLQRFVIDFAALLNECVGEAWSRGELTVSQEHLYSEQMQHVLRGGIVSIPPGAQQPRVVLTTLPGEEHQLGLLMAHVCIAAEGARCISLGVQTPAADIADVVTGQAIEVVALSFSESLKLNVAHDMLEDLRGRLPPSIAVWAGGKLWTRARRPVPGVQYITLLTQIPGVIAAHRESRLKRPHRNTRAPA